MIRKISLSVLIVFVFSFVNLQTVIAEEVKAEVKTSESQEVVSEKAQKLEAKATADLKESEIPLKTEIMAKADSAGSTTGKVIFSILILAGMAGAAFFYLKRMTFANKNSKSAMQIKILTQHHLGPKKSLAIVRVAGESILIGVTDQNISMIKSLSLIDDEVPSESQYIPQSFEQALNENPTNKNSAVATKSNMNTSIDDLAQEMEDDFSFSGLKTTVAQKLKSMRNIQ